PLAAVDQEDVGERLVAVAEPTDATADDLADRGEVVHAGDAGDLVPPITGLERQAVDGRDQRADRLRAAAVGAGDALDRPRDLLQLEDLLEPLGPLARVLIEDLGLGVLGEVAAELQVLKRLQLVAEPGGLLELEGLARLAHLRLHLGQDDVLLAVEEEAEP